MAYCISDKGICPHLKFNDKGNLNFHCHYQPERPVQISEEDLRVFVTCPKDLAPKGKK